MISAVQIAQIGCGLFFLTGLLTGLWKYRCMMRSPDAQAPAYVDICHRTALMYSFACLVLAEFAGLSRFPAPINQAAVLVPVLFFASAVATYAVHGWLRDTDNQLRRPHVLGQHQLPGGLIRAYMTLLIVGEVGGFLVLFAGYLQGLG
ncbi:MAG TPA: hypothetical protein VFV27_10775 [Nevskiaceae bacterium]|nr:hypothetical protein [Nevskiaceae bacterium]